MKINMILFIEKLKQVRDKQNQKKEQTIDLMSPEEVLVELKNKQLPTYGTNQERKDRLKKASGKKFLRII